MMIRHPASMALTVFLLTFAAECNAATIPDLPVLDAHATTGQCNPASAEDVTRAMLEDYPQKWKKLEDKTVSYSFLYPSQLQVAAGKGDEALVFSTHRCHASDEKTSEPFTLQVRAFATASYQRGHLGIEQRRKSVDFLHKMVFPTLSGPKAEDTLVTCGPSQYTRDTISSTNGPVSMVRQTLAVEHGKTYEFAYSYTTSNLEADKANTAAFIKATTDIECKIMTSVTFTP